MLWQLRAQRRQSSPELPETVTQLTAADGSILYLVGTAHFSDNSKNDVSMVSLTGEGTTAFRLNLKLPAPFPFSFFLFDVVIGHRRLIYLPSLLPFLPRIQTIRAVQPDVVVVELCQYRVSMLRMDENTLLKEAKDINLEKVQQAIKQVRLSDRSH